MTHAEVQLRDNGLIAPLTRGETYFNYHWLRDACPTTIDPQTRERVFDVTSLKASPSARSARIADDALEIKVNSFFADIDWERVYHRGYEPPFRPDIEDKGDVKYFDKEVRNFAEIFFSKKLTHSVNRDLNFTFPL